MFSKSLNVPKAFRIPIVLLYDLLERAIGIPLQVSLLFTGLELNQDSFALPSMENTKVDVAATSSSFDDGFPAFRSKGLDKAKKKNIVYFLRDSGKNISRSLSFELRRMAPRALVTRFGSRSCCINFGHFASKSLTG